MAESTPDPSPSERMRQALEQKKNREHLADQKRRNTGTIHGSQVDGGGKRAFRRKSG